MYCKWCGKEIESELSFCPFCGKTVEQKTSSVEEGLSAETPIHSKRPTSRGFGKKVWIIAGISAVMIAAILVVLFVFIIPAETNSEPVLSTSIGDFIYEFSYENNYNSGFDELTANLGYKFALVKLTPVDGQKPIHSDDEKSPLIDTQMILGDKTYDMTIISESYSPEGQLTDITFVYVIDEDDINENLEFILP